MRWTLALALVVLVTSASAQTPREFAAANGGATERCPQQRFASFAPGVLNDELTDFTRHLPSAQRVRIERTASARCLEGTTGASCDNVAIAGQLATLGKLHGFATHLCARAHPSAHELALARSGDAGALGNLAERRLLTDASVTEDVDEAISMALPRNPRAVLVLLEEDRSLPPVHWFCIDRRVEPSPAEHRAFVNSAHAAVAGVTDVRLRAVRDACLASLAG